MSEYKGCEFWGDNYLGNWECIVEKCICCHDYTVCPVRMKELVKQLAEKDKKIAILARELYNMGVKK